jgi:hypothetical protein
MIPINHGQPASAQSDFPLPDSNAIGGNARSRNGTGLFKRYNYSTNHWDLLGYWSPEGWHYYYWPSPWNSAYVQQIGDTFYAGMAYTCDGSSTDTFVIEHAEWWYHTPGNWVSQTRRAGSSGTPGGNSRYHGDTMWVWGTWGGSNPSEVYYFDKIYVGIPPVVDPPTPSWPPNGSGGRPVHPTLYCRNRTPHDQYGWELYEGATQIEIAYSLDSLHYVQVTLQDGHTYNWRAMIKVGGVWSAFFSPNWYFTVGTTPVPPPTPSWPPNGGGGQPVHPTLYCRNRTPHDQYGWELYEGATQIEIAYSLDSLHYVQATLQDGHTYNWRAMIRVGGVWSDFFSPNSYFTVGTSGFWTYMWQSPGPLPDGITWDGTYIWITSETDQRIYKVNPSNGSVISWIPTPASLPTGLAWDGTYIWCADGGTWRIYKLNPSNGSVVSSFSAPGGHVSCEGLTWDGGYIWNTNWNDNIIWKLNPASGQIVSTITLPGKSGLTGLARQPYCYLWVSDQGADSVYCVDLRTGGIVTRVYAPDTTVQDLAIQGSRGSQYLWTCGYFSAKVFRSTNYLAIDEDLGQGATSLTGTLCQAHPNPFHAWTMLSYSLPADAGVNLEILGIDGRVVRTLANGKQTAGTHKVLWDGCDAAKALLPSGVYFCRLQAGGLTESIRIVKLK